MARGRNPRRHKGVRRPVKGAKSRPMARLDAQELILAKAKQEPDPRVALTMFQSVVEACEKPAATAGVEGQSKGPEITPAGRTYLKALFGAAATLRRLNRHEEAVEGFYETLQWDAADHQFARYWLAASLFELERHDELRQVLTRYEETSAVWRYAQALLAFRQGGDTDEARRLLDEAFRLDAGFVDYLLGESQVYAERPIRFGRDRDETTHSLAALFLPAWRSTAGAASWVRRALRVPLGEQPAGLPFPRGEIRELPRRKVAWQLGLRLLDPDEPASGADQGWILGIVNLDDRKMMLMTVIEGDPTPEAVWPEVLTALLQPMEGKPHRPARLEVPRAEFCSAWQPMLEEVSVRCVFQRDPQPITDMLGGMALLVKQHRLPSLREDLDPRQFPQTDEVWQADFFHTPMMVSDDEVGVERPWSAVVVDKRSYFVLSNEVICGEPTPEHLWEYLLRTMAHPGPRDPMRPATVELSDSDCYDFLKPKLGELGVGCVLADELPQLEEFCRTFASSRGGPEICALADGPGVTMEQMESFYYAAARYFELAPWKRVLGEIPIEIRCRGLRQGTMYAIVLGRTGVTLGLALYRGWGEVLAAIRGERTSEELSGFSIVFDEVTILAPVDLHLVERNGWPIRTPEAYPAVMRLEPGRQPQSPTGEDLDYIESCLRVIPDFVAGNWEAKTFALVTNGKPLKMRLSWTFPVR